MIKLVEWIDILPIIKDVSIVVATILATTFATTKIRDRSDRIKMYKGFLQEIRQNIYIAQHNLEQAEKYLKDTTKGEVLFFRDDFWNMSKTNGHFLDLPSNIQITVYEIYMKQYIIGEMLAKFKNIFSTEITQKVKKEITESLLPKLKDAEKNLQKILG